MLDQLHFSSSNAIFIQKMFNNCIIVHKMALNQPSFILLTW
uniref:Uncharacterized protein n=1 Tax=Rhizophora mucronata TaxID=61149 RepID=A0A2P2KIW8_RHIMU